MNDARGTPEGILALRLLLVLAVYLAIRVVFLIDHSELYAAQPVSAVVFAFVSGFRFDLSAIAYSNLPFILLSLAPTSVLARRWYQWTLRGLYLAVNGVLVMLMVADVAYFPFTGTRVTLDVFALRGEVTAQADQLLLNYAGHGVLALALLVVLVVFYPRHRPTEGGAASRWTHRAIGVATVLVLSALAARGGLQKKPLKPIHAFASGEHELGILTLSSAFTLVHSPRARQLTPVAYFDTDAEAEALIASPFGFVPQLSQPNTAPRQNVVLLILESVSVEYWGGSRRAVEVTPFLDSLARQGTFLVDNFANGRRSMDALPSILIGVPLLKGRSIAVSGYQGNEWRGLGYFLGIAGYHTSMFHGAPKGTMYFDAIASMSGIADFRPLESYPGDRQSSDYDGNWGLFDEPFLKWSAEEMSRFPQPFFSTVFTISTHHPYRVPTAYADVLPKGTMPFHQSLAYLDLSVREFFAVAKQQPWYDSTLFILVGDHTPPARDARYETALGRYMVPMLLFHPTQALPRIDPRRITQHVDIFASILDYAGATPARIPLFGTSLFSSAPGEAMVENNGGYWLVTREGVLERGPTGDERLLAYRREQTGSAETVLHDPALAARLSNRLSAFVQHYTSAMINNAFYRAP